MKLHFVGKDPDSPSGGCPAVFVDESSGDLLFQGLTVTEAGALSFVDSKSAMQPGESVVRLPARMRAIILEACGVDERADV
ncbi:hypothetical protein [Actinospica robiniae]|uniref:hypothetical protein n=1 Tax=Actinospica robiniae TaxID=304901 RepID=UPI000552DCC9|nr:hypothetical protein [Actinospica robiniae]